MKKHLRIFAVAAALCMLLAACASETTGSGDGAPSSGDGTTAPPAQTAPPIEIDNISDAVIDADLTATITLGNWPPDTAPEQELILFEGYKGKMAAQYPSVTVIPAYYSYTLSNYIGMARGGTAPTLFQPPFTDPQLLISQDLVADVTDALRQFGLLEKFSPGFITLLGDENGRIYGLPPTDTCWVCT